MCICTHFIDLIHRGDRSTCASFPRTAQVKAGENRADGALDRRAGAATEVSIKGGTCNRDNRVSPCG